MPPPHDGFLTKLLLIGDSAVGKSCLLLRFCDDAWDSSMMGTIGIDFRIRTIELDGKRLKLQVWDTSGRERFRTITTAYYRVAMGILLVYDVTDEQSFNNIRTWHNSIEQYASEGVNKILIGNKSDWMDKRVVTEEQGRELANELGIRFMETSAKVNEGVEEAFFTLARDVKTRLIDSQADATLHPQQGRSTSSSAISSPPSYAAHARSDGSNATNPNLDIYEDMAGITLEMRNTNITESSRDVNPDRNGKGPRYLYYRIYARDGAIETNNRIYSNDEFLSRIFTKSVAPPHTVASLKKHLCKTEGFSHGSRHSSLFASLSDKEATLEAEFISLFGPSGPGSSEHDPIALVVDKRARKSIAANLKNLPKCPDARDPSYIYYRMYSSQGEISSKIAFSSDNSLGRIGTLTIPPPHTVASLKACLMRLEGTTASHSGTQKLFTAMNSANPMNDDDPIPLLMGDYPGRHEDDPMAFVNDTSDSASDSDG